MSDGTGWIERLGREVGSAFPPSPEDERRQAQKRALLASVATGRAEAGAGAGAVRRPLLRPTVVLAAAACLAVVAGAGVIVGWHVSGKGSGALRGLAGVSMSPDGLWFETPKDSGLRTTFKDGSTVMLGADTKARITESGDDGVSIVLARGSLDAGVRKGTGIRWEFGAGSYRMSVRGTRFLLRWDEAVEVMDLEVSEGLVLVTGAGISDDGIEVPAGSALRANGRERTVALRSMQPGGASGQAFESAQPVAPLQAAADGPVDRGDAASAGDAEGAGDRSGPEWRSLAEKGQYTQAMKAASEIGVQKLASSLPLDDLWILADAARYSGDAKSARIVLLAVRDRFAKSQKARIAAYLLGRLCAEKEEKPSEAVVWFKVYLKEDPSGPLAEEALGRLVDALVKCGRLDDAADAAREYLAEYPDGVFADLARSVADR